MTAQIILYATLALPLVLGLLFRVSTSHLFFSIMAGELLARYFGHDVEKQVGDSTQLPVGEIILVLAPLALTAILLKGSLPRSKVVLHIIPLAVTGVVLAAFLLPLMPANLQTEIASSRVGDFILESNRLIIGGIVVLQLVALWLLNRNEHGSKHH